MYKATVNHKNVFEIGTEAKGYTVNAKSVIADIVHLGGNQFHLLHENKSYNIEIVKSASKAKFFQIKINGLIYEVGIKDQLDLLLEKLGMDNANDSKINDIKAPMPGLILDIHVKVGDNVDKGDAIMVLEAMKMENVLKSPGSGEIKALRVAQGDSVEKNQVLVQF